MENHNELRQLLSKEEAAAELRLKMLTRVFETEAFGLPQHIQDALGCLRQNAEEDLSNLLHIQSTLPSSHPTVRPKSSPSKNPMTRLRSLDGPMLGQVDEGVETALAATDDLFLMEGMDLGMSQDSRSPPLSAVYSDDEREVESEPDEGIHIPRKTRESGGEVAASLPVGIPWDSTRIIIPSHQDEPRPDGSSPATRDIAASIQAMARSVHTSSMFGDSVFGDLPRPRLNTGSKN